MRRRSAADGVVAIGSRSGSAGQGNCVGAVYRAVVTATGALALGAFILSLVALRDLAVIAGIRTDHAPILPLVIDLAIGAETLALVAIAGKPARKARTAPSNATRSLSAGATAAPVRRNVVSANTASSVTANRDAERPSQLDRAVVDADRATLQIAKQSVAQKANQQSVEVVAAILTAHQAGHPLDRIVKNLGVRHSAVSLVLGAADARRVYALAPA